MKSQTPAGLLGLLIHGALHGGAMVGVMNEQWDIAMSVMVREFSQAEQDAGWPASMKPGQLAGLQRPYRMGDIQTVHFCTRLLRRIKQACNDDTLAHEVTVTQSQKFVTGGRISFVKSWEGSSRRFDPPKTQPAKEVTVYHVTAPAFAAWLAAQGETPSVHIQAWFDAVGVAGAAAQDEQPKPLQRTAAQDAAILKELNNQGYDPLALPKNPPGRPGVKAAIRAAIDGKGLFVGGSVFNRAWERLSAYGEIVTKD